MNKTKIEWVKNPDGTQGYTWNPITGCLNNCSYCYARKLADGRLFKRYTDNINHAPVYSDGKGISTGLPDTLDPFYPRFWEDRMIEPITDISWSQRRRWGEQAKEKGIFACDMGELFGDWIPSLWQEKIFEVIHRCPRHRFYLLTKQPQNLIKFSPFPDNCWVGVTATNAKSFLEAGRGLEQIQAQVKYISFEPLLDYVGGVWLADWLKSGVGINWVIIGAQTKPYKPPQIEWVREIVEACDQARIPVFLKDNLKPMFGKMTSKEAVAYGDLNRPYLIEEIAFAEGDMLVAHKLRQETPNAG